MVALMGAWLESPAFVRGTGGVRRSSAFAKYGPILPKLQRRRTFAFACSTAWANSPAECIRLRHGRVSAPAHVSVSGIGARLRSHNRTLPTRATVCC